MLRTMSRRFFWVVLGALFVLPDSAVRSQGSVKTELEAGLAVPDAGTWRDLQKGAAIRTLVLERSQPNYNIELKLMRFNTQLITPRVLDSGEFQLRSASAKTFVEKSQAIAAINANYFDERGRPLAYLKTRIREVNRVLSKHSLYTGIFGIGDAGAFVTHRDEFEPVQASEALQSGPLLLHRGLPQALNGDLGRYARRAVIGIDKNGALIVAVADAVLGGLRLGELQKLFADSRWQIDAVELLNLDGGGSAQLYVKSGKFEEWVPGTSEVPVAIGFFNKPK
jgi:exopolysaccharide biosynthesis protein